jgi:hypothetical protein
MKASVPAVIGVAIGPGAIAFSRMPAPTQSALVAARRTQRASASFDEA